MRWGARTALLGAVLLAVMPLHVRESHYVLTDVPATFFVTLTFLLSLRAHERSTVRAFALAGAAAGLAAATKYNGGLALVMPLLAWALTPAVRPSRLAALFWVVGGMIATFLLAAPYTFLDLPTFLNQFARLSSEYRSHTSTLEPLWQIYLKHLRNALAWPGSLLVVAGLVLGSVRIVTGPSRINWVRDGLSPVVLPLHLAAEHPLRPLPAAAGAVPVAARRGRRRVDRRMAAAPRPAARAAQSRHRGAYAGGDRASRLQRDPVQRERSEGVDDRAGVSVDPP
jgi:4-amino-4-deoxy-L-arabinose transferase-like glycosyltransferase